MISLRNLVHFTTIVETLSKHFDAKLNKIGQNSTKRNKNLKKCHVENCL